MHNSLDSLLWKYTEGGEIMHVASTSLRKQRERTAPRLWHQLRYSHLNREGAVLGVRRAPQQQPQVLQLRSHRARSSKALTFRLLLVLQ